MKMTFRILIFSLILTIIRFKDYLLMNKGRRIISILCYHRVNDRLKDDMTVSTASLESQIRYLKKHYEVISGKELDSWLAGRSKLKKAVLITFDDGYEDNYTNALPILEKYECPAVFFVPTGYVGTNRDFEFDIASYPGLVFKKMTWDQLKDAGGKGIEIGIHSDTHINFKQAGFNEAKKEIEVSLEKYYTHIESKSVLMAYPYGAKEDISSDIRAYISQHENIRALFAAYGGRNVEPFHRDNLKRIFISDSDIGIVFRYRIEGGWRSLIR